MPGLGTSFGRGGATTFVQDLQNADCILIEGSNFAECHPVAFRFVMKAKERGATVIHVDPRFTRTSAVADLYAPIRSGSDIVFLGALVNWVLTNERYFRDYVVAYTNASSLVREDFADTEDLDGIFSGWQAGETQAYDTATWAFELEEVPRFDGNGTVKVVKRDPTLQHPRCVLNVLRRHFARYTPEMVERVCGTSRDTFERICTLLADNSGRERTTAFAYAVGWTQHTVGVQYIRTAAILQMLLGNIGRPGGGIMALRGHADIQGATDIATLYDLLPGYLPMPSVHRDEQTLAAYLKANTKATGWWSNTPKYMVSLLKAFYGEAARAENDFAYEYLPQLTGDHSTLPTQVAMRDGLVRGFFVIGQNPMGSGMNNELGRAALAKLEWMVNVDSYETDTAAFWKAEGVDPSTVGTECFFIPTAALLEKNGTMTNTNRMLQWHDKALEPAGESKSDLWLIYDLGKRLRALYADSDDPKDRALLDLTWDYEHDDARERRRGEPSALKVLQEINGYRVEPGKHQDACEQVGGFTELAADGTTASGGWIYSGVCPDKTTNKARNRKADDWTSLGWGYSWPSNRRILYNRASADPAGKPWSERKKYVWWDAQTQTWTGVDVPDFPLGKAPDAAAKPGADGLDAHSGADPFIMQLDGRAQIFVAAGLKDGPLPTHYEPVESVVPNVLYAQQHNPTLREWRRRDNPLNGAVNPDFPYVLTTYRLTEHSGIMTRYVPWLAELQPALFVEIDPELAVAKNIRNGEWMTVRTAIGEIEGRALVSGRMRPLRLGRGQRVHQVGVPYNFGASGLIPGDSVGDLVPLVMEPNVSIQESKTMTCDVRPGRRAARTGSAINAAVPPADRAFEGQPTTRGLERKE
ncbi:MAG: formate dehydrogenase-N subunit alpha [Candidatus Baltobacteraceae bacterium]